MNKAAVFFVALSIFSVLGVSGLPPARAHQATVVGDISIVGGWVNEPPLVNQLNGVELTITHNSTGAPITNAVAQLDVSIQKGGLTKPLEFKPTEEPGVYVADLLPTQLGQYGLSYRGSVAGQEINTDGEIEDVGDTRPFEFPARQAGNSTTIPEDIIDQLQQVIAGLNSQVDQATAASEKAVTAAEQASSAAADLKGSADRAYVFGMVGVGLGVAGIVIGVAAITRGRDKT